MCNQHVADDRQMRTRLENLTAENAKLRSLLAEVPTPADGSRGLSPLDMLAAASLAMATPDEAATELTAKIPPSVLDRMILSIDRMAAGEWTVHTRADRRTGTTTVTVNRTRGDTAKRKLRPHHEPQ
jgi:hypothetical protein